MIYCGWFGLWCFAVCGILTVCGLGLIGIGCFEVVVVLIDRCLLLCGLDVCC